MEIDRSSGVNEQSTLYVRFLADEAYEPNVVLFYWPVMWFYLFFSLPDPAHTITLHSDSIGYNCA